MNHRYLWIAGYVMTIGAAGFVYYSEVFPNHLRAKGTCAAICAAALADLLFLQVASTAFRVIGWKYFLVRISISHSRSLFCVLPTIIS